MVARVHRQFVHFAAVSLLALPLFTVCCASSRSRPGAPLQAEPPGSRRPHAILPSDPDYCRHCPCEAGRVFCPMDEPSLCTLSGLLASQRDPSWGNADASVVRTRLLADVWACGKYVVVDEVCGTDCGHLFAYEVSTGRLVASLSGGGILWQICRDGYESNWWGQPPGFVFPKRAECSPMEASMQFDAGRE
jgi:hypothetical protein